MKKIFLLCLAMATLGLYAQNAFFPITPGVAQTYVHKNDKGKADNYTRQTITDVKTSGDEKTVSYSFEMLDMNRKSKSPPEIFPCKVKIKGDVVTFDMNEFFAAMQQDAQLSASMEVTGVPMSLSGNLKPGDKIPDADMLMTIDMGMMKMSTNIKMKNGKCLQIEDVTVPAGAFKCHKITQTVSATVMGMSVESTAISWYAIGIGTVKSDNYDDKGKLQGTTELFSISK